MSCSAILIVTSQLYVTVLRKLSDTQAAAWQSTIFSSNMLCTCLSRLCTY